jgi:hypothetical protein
MRHAPPTGQGQPSSLELLPFHADSRMNLCPRSPLALRRGGSGSRGHGADARNRFLFDHMINFGSGHLFQHPTSAGEERAVKLVNSVPGAPVDVVVPADCI